MGANKNIFSIENTGHGHFCQRCKSHSLCSLKKCLKKVKGDEFSSHYWETRPELVDVFKCSFCEQFTNELCQKIRETISSYHFGNKDKRLSKFGLYNPDF